MAAPSGRGPSNRLVHDPHARPISDLPPLLEPPSLVAHDVRRGTPTYLNTMGPRSHETRLPVLVHGPIAGATPSRLPSLHEPETSRRGAVSAEKERKNWEPVASVKSILLLSVHCASARGKRQPHGVQGGNAHELRGVSLLSMNLSGEDKGIGDRGVSGNT